MSNNVEWESNFTWRIENFSSCACEIEDKLVSPKFKVKSLCGREWCLWLYPAGDTKLTKEYISCFLAQILENKSDKECVIDFEISLSTVKRDNLESKTYKNKIFGRSGNSCGWDSFSKIHQVTAELKNCSEDTLIVRCSIKNKEEKTLVQKDARTRISAEKYIVEWAVAVLSNGSFFPGRHFFCLQDNLYEICFVEKERDLEIHICKLTYTILNSYPITAKITLLDARGNEALTKTETHTYDCKSKKETWTFPSPITKQQLQNDIDEYENNKRIILLCEFSVRKGIVEANVSNASSEDISNIIGLVNLSDNLQALLSNKTISDVKLQISEGKELQSHRSVLGAHSAMFDREILENRTGIADIEDVDYKTMKSFLEFLYSGMIADMNFEKATQLLLVADKYQVSALKELCAKFLISALSVKTVYEILMLANKINHEPLKITSIDYISANAKEIFSSMEWSDLVEKNAKLSIEVNLYIGENFTFIPKPS